jgi:hypothetical protein
LATEAARILLRARAHVVPALLCACALWLLSPAFAAPALAQVARPAPGEAEVEAAYLVNFLRYTQWPASSFENANSPYVITVVGSERTVDGVRAVAAAAGNIDGRAIEVRWIPDGRGSRAAPFDSAQDQAALAQMRASHLVFFHRSAGRVHPQVLSDLSRAPVLTVSDTDGFTGDGGMLGLVRDDRRIVFQANSGAIRNANLLVSAKVMKLARAATAGRAVP